MRTKRSIANTLLLLLMGVGVFLIIFQSDKANAQPKKALLKEYTVELPPVRFSTTSNWFAIPIINIGNDTTSVKSIVISSGDISEFELDPSTIPTPTNQYFLDSSGGAKDTIYCKIRATPQPRTVGAPDTIGNRFVLLKVTSTESIYFDTVICKGVEPWIEEDRDTVSFVLDYPPYSGTGTDVRRDTFYYTNTGTANGHIHTLLHYNNHFSLPNEAGYADPLSPVELIPGQTTLARVAVAFTVPGIGVYLDSVKCTNDSRNNPVVYLLGFVRAHLQFPSLLDLGSFGSCEPLDTVISLYNPTPLTITIDSLYLSGQAGGLQITSPLVLPIILKPKDTYSVGIKYTYPPDSANGKQDAYLMLKQPIGGESIDFRYDSMHITLSRTLVELALASAPPPYKPNALDAPFRLPIYLKGDRIGKQELNDITVHLKFSNDLLQPIGVDRSGSLSEESVANGIPKQPIGIWDESTKTYSISSNNIKLSSNAGKNTLLFTVLTRAFLTTDSAVTMYEYLDYNTAKPCGYHVLRDSLVIDYANECGDATIRRAVLQNKSIITLHAPQPDPAVMSEFGKITIPFDAVTEIDLGWKLYNESGTIIDNGNSHFQAGKNTLIIERNAITSSGVFILKADVRDPDGRIFSFSTKFSVVK